MRTRKQSVVRQILKVCKGYARMCVVNTRSQNSVTNKTNLLNFSYLQIPI